MTKNSLPDSSNRSVSGNVLFTLSSFSFDKHFGRYSKGGFLYNFSEGIGSIASYIKQSGYNVSFHDSKIDGDFGSLTSRIKRDNIGVVGVPCYVVDFDGVINLSSKLKRLFPELVFVTGNVHPSNYPEDVLRIANAIDYVIIGEGEIPFLHLLEYLNKGGDRTQIQGLAWREGGKVHTNSRVVPDITTLPMPAYDIFPMRKYILQPTLVKCYPTYTLMASRGCPFSCAFCDVKSMMGKKVRYRTPEQMVENMGYLVDNYGAEGFAFQDSTLTINKNWVQEFCKLYRKSSIKKPWMAYSRVDTINRELIQEMRDAGCWQISFGMESGNQKSLNLLLKKTTVEMNCEIGQEVINAGIVLQTTFIVCLPGEDEEDAINTYRFALKVGAHICRFFLPTPYPNTRLFDLSQEETGRNLDPHQSELYDFLNYTKNLPYINPRIGAKKMIELCRKFERNYYLHPKIIYRNLKQLRSLNDFRKCSTAFRAVYGK